VASERSLKTRSDRIFDFAALCTWLTASVAMAGTSLILYGQDFRGYYAAARVLLSGGNPYDYGQLAPILLEATGHVGNNPYYYAPWFAWLVTPFAALPFEPARAAWMLFNLLVWCAALWQLSRLLGWPETGRARWLMFLLATFLFAWITWRYEQTGILLFALMVAALEALRRGRWGWAGLWLALLLVKPNISLIPVTAISLWLLLRGHWQPVVVTTGIVMALFAAASLITPGWYEPLLQPGFGSGLVSVLDGPDRVVGVRVNSTLLDWLTTFGVSRGWRAGIYVVAAAAGAAILLGVVLQTRSLLLAANTSLLVGFAITPYALQYDFPPLTLPLFWSLAVLAPSRQGRWVAASIGLFLASVLIWERPISDAYWMVIALTALTFWSWKYTKITTLDGPGVFIGSIK
jgi:hypothetical protein